MESIPHGDIDTTVVTMVEFFAEFGWAWSFLDNNMVGFTCFSDHIVPFGGFDNGSSELEAIGSLHTMNGIASIPSIGGSRLADLQALPCVAINVNLAFAIFNGHTMGFGLVSGMLDILLITRSTMTNTINCDVD